jgi:hypothetical protein
MLWHPVISSDLRNLSSLLRISVCSLMCKLQLSVGRFYFLSLTPRLLLPVSLFYEFIRSLLDQQCRPLLGYFGFIKLLLISLQLSNLGLLIWSVNS